MYMQLWMNRNLYETRTKCYLTSENRKLSDLYSELLRNERRALTSGEETPMQARLFKIRFSRT